MSVGIKYQDEKGLAEHLISKSEFLNKQDISANAKEIILYCRKNKHKGTKLDAFMEEYGLSNHEGVALMCLAESLIRIPDNETRNDLINEKITSSKWSKHLNQAESFLVNSATLGLKISKKVLLSTNKSSQNWLTSLSKKIGENSIREAIELAMKVLSNEFVFCEDIKGLKNSPFLDTNRCSFDMLGEAARTSAQEEKYFQSYLDAINSTAKLNSTLKSRHGVSIKLSALYSNFDTLHEKEIKKNLYPRIFSLCEEAKFRDVPITIDAEEQDKLNLSLSLIKKILLDQKFKKWTEVGLAIQAYGKRSLAVIEHLNECLNDRDSIHVRLVKGAYWDYEIKEAQKRGMNGYSVFTNKSLTDLNFLIASKALLESPKIFPLFATHNAYSVSAINEINKEIKKEIEFQRLYGMGELLYKGCREVLNINSNTSVYCPVGKHKELLPYLVRRLLENGANSSFINNLQNKNVDPDSLCQNPAEIIKNKTDASFNWLPLPSQIYKPRINSMGFDLSEKDEIDNLLKKVNVNKEYKAFSSKNLKIKKSDQIPFTFVDKLGTKQTINFLDPIVLSRIKISPSVSWKDDLVKSRSKVLLKTAEEIESNPSEIIGLLMREAGKTLPDACDEIREAVDLIRYYALEAQQLQKPKELKSYTGEVNILSHEAKGVCLCLSPWNFPLAITVGQIAASLVVGNTVIAKPSENGSLIGQYIIEIFLRNGVPEDALFLLLGKNDVGSEIIKTQEIDLIAFTGSLKAAKSISQQISMKEGKIIPLISETGGLNTMIIDSSALIERASDDILRSAFNSAGQRCSSLRILLIHKDIYSETVEMICGAIERLNIGSPILPDTDIGPIVNKNKVKELQGYVERFRKNKKVKFQAYLKKELEEDYFPPTIIELGSLDDINEEEFGPIVHVMSFVESDLKDHIKKIEEKGFALTLGIHTRVDSKITEISNLTSTGNIYVNRDIIGATVESQPFGGNNLSGTGFKAGGPNYLLQFVNEKTTSINTVAIGGNPDLLNKKLVT